MKETVFKYLERTFYLEIFKQFHRIKLIGQVGNEVVYPYQLMGELTSVFGLTPYGAKKYAEEWLQGYGILVNDKYWVSWGSPERPSLQMELVRVQPMDAPTGVGLAAFLDITPSGATHEGVVIKPRSQGYSSGLHPNYVKERARNIEIVRGLE